ncbi:hypothetical protein ACFL1V_02180 [Pseudomonadota bacterium]
MKRPWENDSCETVSACYALYSVPVAAALWCGVPPDQVDEELRDSVPTGTTALGRSILRSPHLKCLEHRIRAIHSAIDSGELASSKEDGMKVEEHVAYERRHVYGLDLKEWAKKIAPTERPVFLFDDIERDTHESISTEAYQALKAELEAKKTQLSQSNERLREIGEAKNQAESERDTLRGIVDSLTEKLQSTGVPGMRAESTYKNIIAALLDCIAGALPSVEKHPSFENEAKLIEAIEAHFQGYGGLSKSTLSRKFPEAKRALAAQ